MGYATDQTLQSTPPTSQDVTERVADQWWEQKRRRRMLSGQWRQDLKDELALELSGERLTRQGRVKTTKNIARSVVNQLAILYDRPPILEHADPAAVAAMEAITHAAGLWQLALTLQQQTIGLREGFYHLSVIRGEKPYLLARVVPADLIDAVADPDNPDVPHTITEYRIREVDGRDIWTRDRYSIEGGAEVFAIETSDGKEGLTALVNPELAAWLAAGNYWRNGAGKPILPWSIYHAKRTSQLWNQNDGVELFDGALNVASKLVMVDHTMRDTGWPQRSAIDCVAQGASVDDDGNAYVDLDPATILNFKSTNHKFQGKLHQFEPGGDAGEMLDAVQALAEWLAADFDIQPGDLVRTHVDARSGHAIQISREGQRHAQRRSEPQQLRGDRQTLSVIASLWNQATGESLPEDGWTLRYPGLPLSTEERAQMLEEYRLRAELGATSLPVLVSALEGITEDQARDRLRIFKRDALEFPAPGAARPTTF